METASVVLLNVVDSTMELATKGASCYFGLLRTELTKP
jgi:hypothetical protein